MNKKFQEVSESNINNLAKQLNKMCSVEPYDRKNISFHSFLRKSMLFYSNNLRIYTIKIAKMDSVYEGIKDYEFQWMQGRAQNYWSLILF